MERRDIASQLSELAGLRADGMITSEEFTAAKATLLGGTVGAPGDGGVTGAGPARSANTAVVGPPVRQLQLPGLVGPVGPPPGQPPPGRELLAPPPRRPGGHRGGLIVGAVVTAVVVLLIGVVVVVSRAVGPAAPACDPASARQLPPEGLSLLPGSTGEAAGAPPGGAELWFAGSSPSGFAVVDACTEAVLRTVPGSFTAEDVEFSPDGDTLYTADSFESTVTAIDADSGAVAARIRVADHHYQKRITLTPDGTQLLATDSYGDKLSIIDTRSYAVTHVVPFTGSDVAGAWDVITSVDGTTAFVSRPGDDEIVVVDVAGGQILGTVPTGDYPRGLARDDRGRIYVANNSDGTITVVDPTSRTATDTVEAGDGVDVIATDASGRRLVALSTSYPTAYVIDSGDSSGSARPVALPAVLRPGGEKATSAPARYYTYRSLVVSPDGRRVHVSSDGNGVTALTLS